MKTIVLFSIIPLALASTLVTRPSRPTPPSVETSYVRMVRTTAIRPEFVDRWQEIPVVMVADATPPRPPLPVPRPRLDADTPPPYTAPPSVVKPPPARRNVITRKASLDVCARVGWRKVHYGRTWRCRR